MDPRPPGGSHACPLGAWGGVAAPLGRASPVPVGRFSPQIGGGFAAPKDGLRPSYDGAASLPQRRAAPAAPLWAAAPPLGRGRLRRPHQFQGIR